MCRIWSRFQATRHDGSSVKLRIQDLPENRIDDAVHLFLQYFIRDEPFHKAAGVAQNPQAIAECQVIVTESMTNSICHHVIICCEDRLDGTVGQIVGVSSIELATVGVEPCEGIKFLSDEVQLTLKLIHITSNLQDIMKGLHISKFYHFRGMIVHPDFRQLGIATEFLKTRRMACVSNNVPAMGALVTSVATQKAAEKDNWETVRQVNLEDLGHEHGVTFRDGGVSKLMIWKNPQFIPSI